MSIAISYANQAPVGAVMDWSRSALSSKASARRTAGSALRCTPLSLEVRCHEAFHTFPESR
jgi:hypothetical protein